MIFLVVFVTSWAPFMYLELSFTLLINKYASKYPYKTTEMEQQSNLALLFSDRNDSSCQQRAACDSQAFMASHEWKTGRQTDTPGWL